jgi:hypothetical protein
MWQQSPAQLLAHLCSLASWQGEQMQPEMHHVPHETAPQLQMSWFQCGLFILSPRTTSRPPTHCT